MDGSSLSTTGRVGRLIIRSCLLGLATFVIAFPVTHSAQADEGQSNLNGTTDGAPGLETFRLADRSNFRRLSNGDFLFRLARETRTGVVYWAYLGTTEHVVATVPDPQLLTDDEEARRIALRIADLPTRVGCGVGLIHQSTVYLVAETAAYGESGYEPNVSPLFAIAEVRNDASGKTPAVLLSFRNFMTDQ